MNIENGKEYQVTNLTFGIIDFYQASEIRLVFEGLKCFRLGSGITITQKGMFLKLVGKSYKVDLKLDWIVSEVDPDKKRRREGMFTLHSIDLTLRDISSGLCSDVFSRGEASDAVLEQLDVVKKQTILLRNLILAEVLNNDSA